MQVDAHVCRSYHELPGSAENRLRPGSCAAELQEEMAKHANGGASAECGRLLFSILSAGEHYNTQAVKAYEKTVPPPVGAEIARLVG